MNKLLSLAASTAVAASTVVVASALSASPAQASVGHDGQCGAGSSVVVGTAPVTDARGVAVARVKVLFNAEAGKLCGLAYATDATAAQRRVYVAVVPDGKGAAAADVDYGLTRAKTMTDATPCTVLSVRVFARSHQVGSSAVAKGSMSLVAGRLCTR